jgi:hypothetical protein
MWTSGYCTLYDDATEGDAGGFVIERIWPWGGWCRLHAGCHNLLVWRRGRAKTMVRDQWCWIARVRLDWCCWLLVELMGANACEYWMLVELVGSMVLVGTNTVA